MTNSIYVIGHKNPDTDSICSAIGYAAYLNQQDFGRYVPARCGEIGAETAFVLSHFGVETPVLIESVEPTVADIPFTYTHSATMDLPTIDVVDMMEEQDVRNIPITDHEGLFVGLVSEHGLARAYVRRTRIEPLSVLPIEIGTLARILEAEVIVQNHDLLEGNVYISIDALHVTLSRLTKDDIAIVGDNEPSQLALIQAGIALLIIADNAPAGERVITAAKDQGVSIFSTKLDAFGVAKMINLSLPASEVMATDVPIIHQDDGLDYVKQLVTNSRYRTACIVDEDGRLLGMISRNTFVYDIQKSVILVDHNEYSQAVDGIENAEILEIIDHHRLGAMTTLKPIRFVMEPVGSTSTIIASIYQESGRDLPDSIGGILLAGILSDTLGLKMSTTTKKDEEMAAWLAERTGIDPVDFAISLFREGMELASFSIEDLVKKDLKRYSLYSREVAISQVMAPSAEFAKQHDKEIRSTIENLRELMEVDIFVVLITSVFENGSDLFAAGDEHTLQRLGYLEQPLRLEGVMSRKKDFLPQFGQLIRGL
ncbi:MAG: putative manganese-dependent inorganic diphosphatase [Methanocalculus sp. MSAO_Arc1]|uniref:putative manganese-dependent inorganic diphosphatase n=1 Tax=Methanocalculus TaxID=71151 RepID=UPI000FEFC3BB|nr:MULTISPECIES: putative manganese-dependent inorganic diphosphatase [unclassified Methanocalculus]MCP1661961.1 manganese-dependent inorganic pyrophosphatase [Methanocalculus sp. AMF5]RQD81155.1 MAG: putative manganese-dependent inorganic diphosphatase [Methanocalculus sp. MSAO_Arc1]